MDFARNVTTVDLVWNNQIFSRYTQVFDKKWKIYIGNNLFKNQIHFREFLAENRAKVANSSYGLKVVCYRKLLVGCGQLAGLDGQAMHRQQSFHHIRKVLWEKYAPKEKLPVRSSPSSVRILMLEKNSSSWQHTNYITNWKEMVRAVSDLQDVTVTAYSPAYVPFESQVVNYRSSDVVISLWGGISMLNFLLPAGKVEIVITSWFQDNDMMPMPNSSSIKGRRHRDQHLLECPDFDAFARMGQDIKHLRYCTRDNGHTPNHIEMENFIPLVKTAVNYVRWKMNPGN
mmetsp:Transcript_32456/g.46795  ORF Transcript_32456/g.46795 Transcript_32456/m.46795 type:complete len:286 (+) Transcript_32456:515-1372(+)